MPTADARRQRWSGRLPMTSVTRRVRLLPLRRRHACLRSPFAIGNPCYALLCSVPCRVVPCVLLPALPDRMAKCVDRVARPPRVFYCARGKH